MTTWVEGFAIGGIAVTAPSLTRAAKKIRPRLPRLSQIVLDLWLAIGWTLVLAGVSQLLFADPKFYTQLWLVGLMMLTMPNLWSFHWDIQHALDSAASTIEAGATHEPDPKSLSTQRAGRE